MRFPLLAQVQQKAQDGDPDAKAVLELWAKAGYVQEIQEHRADLRREAYEQTRGNAGASA